MTLPKMANLLYWVGCMASYRVPETARSTIKLLYSTKVNFTTLGVNEGCCGSILIRTGQRKAVVDEYAKSNVKKISATGAKTVVTACAGCFRTFHEEYPKILGSLPFEVLHISQFIDAMNERGEIKFSRPLNLRLTYHDPCHLGRHLNIYDPPRKVVKAIPGVELVEMAKAREDARCCGAGGGLRSAFRELATVIAADRLKLDALPTGAEALVTACPFCVYNLRDAISTYGINMKVYDLPELVCEALGI